MRLDAPALQAGTIGKKCEQKTLATSTPKFLKPPLATIQMGFALSQLQKSNPLNPKQTGSKSKFKKSP